MPLGARRPLVDALSRCFRDLFLQQLRPAFADGELRFTGALAALAVPPSFGARVDTLARSTGSSSPAPPFGGSEQVLGYLGRSILPGNADCGASQREPRDTYPLWSAAKPTEVVRQPLSRSSTWPPTPSHRRCRPTEQHHASSDRSATCHNNPHTPIRPALQSNTFLTYRRGPPSATHPPCATCRQAKKRLHYPSPLCGGSGQGNLAQPRLSLRSPTMALVESVCFELRPRRKMASVAETVSVTTPSAVPLSVLSTGVGLRGRASCGRYKVGSTAVRSKREQSSVAPRGPRRLFGPELRGGTRQGRPLGRWVRPWDAMPFAGAEGVAISRPGRELE